MATDNEILIKLRALDELTPVMLKALQGMEASSAKMAESLNKVSASTEKTEKNTSGLMGGVVSLNAALEIGSKVLDIAHAGWQLFTSTMEHAIGEALEAEKAQTRLNGALVQSGIYTVKGAKDLNEYVDSLEALKGADGEVVKGMIASALQMGLNLEKAKELEQASRQLAAANGITVQEAFSALQGSLTGNTRALAKMVPSVKELSAANLQLGGAIDVVTKATKASYDAYQNSLPAALAKTEVAIANVYKALGQAVTDSPAVRGAVSGIADMFNELSKFVDDNKGSITEWINNAVIVAIDSLSALNIGLDTIYRTGKVAFLGVQGGVQALAMGIKTLIDGPFALLYKALSLIPGEAGEKYGKMHDEIVASLGETAKAVNDNAAEIEKALAGPSAGAKVFEDQLVKVRDKVVEATGAQDALTKSTEASMESSAKQNALLKQKQDLYAGVSIGTAESRKQLEAETQQRDADLKKFQTWLESKKRLAVDAQLEQQAELAKAQASVLTSGGPEASNAAGKSEILAEVTKQQQLAKLRQDGLISEKQFKEEQLASNQRVNERSLQMEQAHALAKAQALGETPEAFVLKQQIEEQNYQLKLQTQMQRAQQEDATAQERQAMVEQMDLDHKARMNQNQEDFWNSQAQKNEQAGNDWEALQARIYAAQVKNGAVMGALIAVQNSQQFAGTKQMLTDLGSLRNSKSKTAFEIGKKAAIAETVINTASAAMKAYTSLAVIPIVGPVLGAAAAGAAIAAGAVQIQNINAQEFKGGQADSGMDSIPQELSGKSFVLSAGERVVQPTANKDLTAFLNSQNPNSPSAGAKGATYNITLNYAGSVSEQDARKMSDMVMRSIRDASERGNQVINAKGVY